MGHNPPYIILNCMHGLMQNERIEYLITRNAEDVMRRLRPNRPEHSRNLWIDAICINQKDNREKAVEVQLMFEIYANANCVNIWLGQGTESTALALKWLR